MVSHTPFVLEYKSPYPYKTDGQSAAGPARRISLMQSVWVAPRHNKRQTTVGLHWNAVAYTIDFLPPPNIRIRRNFRRRQKIRWKNAAAVIAAEFFKFISRGKNIRLIFGHVSVWTVFHTQFTPATPTRLNCHDMDYSSEIWTKHSLLN